MPDQNGIARRHREFAGKVAVSSFDCLLASFLRRLSSAFTVARIVVGDNSEPIGVKVIEGRLQGFEVLGIPMGPQESGHARSGWEIKDRGGLFTFSKEAER